ncbi:hypothetical protein AMTRI_Chr11g150900 [Amborella trichopoda]
MEMNLHMVKEVMGFVCLSKSSPFVEVLGIESVDSSSNIDNEIDKSYWKMLDNTKSRLGCLRKKYSVQIRQEIKSKKLDNFLFRLDKKSNFKKGSSWQSDCTCPQSLYACHCENRLEPQKF